MVDQAGEYRGTMREDESPARDERILAKVMKGFREPGAPYDEEDEPLWEALAILDPVEVTDAKGAIVGYWIGHFTTPSELDAARPGAQQAVRELLE